MIGIIRTRIAVVIRRALFAFVLLTVGAFTTGTLQFLLSYYGTLWGKAMIFIVLGVHVELVFVPWLVYRCSVWSTWSGWLRAVFYGAAFFYGDMVSLNGGVFTWPVFMMNQFRSIGLLVLVWTTLPFAIFVGARLSAGDESQLHSNKFSIRSILAWTSATAFLLAVTPSDMRTRVVVSTTPICFVYVSATFLILWGWSQRWYVCLASLCIAIAFVGFGKELTEMMAIKSQPSFERWTKSFGLIVFVWVAFGAAKLTGVGLSFRSKKGTSTLNEENRISTIPSHTT